jgi:hypothetical protein
MSTTRTYGKHQIRSLGRTVEIIEVRYRKKESRFLSKLASFGSS